MDRIESRLEKIEARLEILKAHCTTWISACQLSRTGFLIGLIRSVLSHNEAAMYTSWKYKSPYLKLGKLQGLQFCPRETSRKALYSSSSHSITDLWERFHRSHRSKERTEARSFCCKPILTRASAKGKCL